MTTPSLLVIDHVCVLRIAVAIHRRGREEGAMTYERDRSPERRIAGDPQAKRSRGEWVAARESKQAQVPPGRSTLAESHAPRLVEPERELDAHIELVHRRLAVLHAANSAGDHYASGSVACEIRAHFTPPAGWSST